MPLYEISWTTRNRQTGGISIERKSRKVVAEGPIAAALKVKENDMYDPIGVSVEQLDGDLAWDDKAGDIAASVVPRIPGGRSVKLSVKERFDLASWLKCPHGNGFIIGDGRLVVDPQQDGGMSVRVFAL